MGGKGVMEADQAQTSVTPAWRLTVAHYVAAINAAYSQDADVWR